MTIPIERPTGGAQLLRGQIFCSQGEEIACQRPYTELFTPGESVSRRDMNDLIKSKTLLFELEISLSKESLFHEVRREGSLEKNAC